MPSSVVWFATQSKTPPTLPTKPSATLETSSIALSHQSVQPSRMPRLHRSTVSIQKIIVLCQFPTKIWNSFIEWSLIAFCFFPNRRRMPGPGTFETNRWLARCSWRSSLNQSTVCESWPLQSIECSFEPSFRFKNHWTHQHAHFDICSALGVQQPTFILMSILPLLAISNNCTQIENKSCKFFVLPATWIKSLIFLSTILSWKRLLHQWCNIWTMKWPSKPLIQ